MDKFLCVNCVKHFKDSEDVFIRNQYCTGFCMLLHVITVKANAVSTKKEIKKKELEAA